MRRAEPDKPDLRKMEFYSGMGQIAAKTEFRSVGLKSLEAWQAQFPMMFEGADSKTPSVTETSAQRISTVFTCLNVLGETRGSLPFGVKITTPTGAKTVYNNPVHRLIHDRPNPYTTAFDFWSTVEKLKRAWGNAYAEIERGPDYQPIAFWLRESWEVSIEKSGNDLFYKYKGRNIRHTDMLHFKNYSLDGICGISTIRQNALTIGHSLKLTQYNSSVIGDRPPGYLTSEKRPKDLQQKNAQRSLWDKRSSSDDEKTESEPKMTMMGGIPYLYGGLEFHAFTLPADDVAYIEGAKLSKSDIYGIFRIPPTFGQDWENAPYNSSEQQDIVFAKYSLASIRGDEQECNEKLFPESNKTASNPLYTKCDVRGLLKGDTKARTEYYTSLIQNGVMSPNMAAELEDFETYEGGDQHFIQLNMVPVDKIAEVIQSQIAAKSSPVTRQSVIDEIKKEMKSKMNGHYAEIEPFLN